MSSILPHNWVETDVKTVVTYQKGKKPKILKDEPFVGSAPYLDIKAFEKDDIQRYGDVESSNLIEEDSIGIVWDGARSGWVGIGKYGAVGSTIAILKPTLVNSYFTYRFLQSKFDYLNTNTRGTGIPHVDPQVLWNISFPLPPLPEQKRIVTKLDGLFAHLEEVKTRLEKVPQLLKDFRQAVLTKAVSGDLTKEYRAEHGISYESNRRELEKLISEVMSVMKTSELPNSQMFCSDWLSVLPEHLAKPEKYSLGIGPFGSNLKVSDYKEAGKPLVFVRNIKANNFQSLNQKFISESKFHELSAHTVSSGDLLITKMGDPPGDCEIYPAELDDAVITSDCLKFRVNDKFASNRFYRNVVNSQIVKSQLGVITKGVAQQKISLKRFKTIFLPFTCRQEQDEIVKRVEILLSRIDKIEERYVALKKKSVNLPQAILAKAFKGELVDQLPTDGDARELLKEIEALKAEVKPKKRSKK